MRTSNAGLKIIMGSEGLRLKPYLCPAGIPTIGYGSTIYPDGTRVRLVDPQITVERALQILKSSLGVYERAINNYVKVKLTQSQFDALVDFAYNVGVTKFKGSTLLRKLNMGDFVGAQTEFGRWVHGGGKVLPGLVKRRAEEAKLFNEKE